MFYVKSVMKRRHVRIVEKQCVTNVGTNENVNLIIVPMLYAMTVRWISMVKYAQMVGAGIIKFGNRLLECF